MASSIFSERPHIWIFPGSIVVINKWSGLDSFGIVLLYLPLLVVLSKQPLEDIVVLTVVVPCSDNVSNYESYKHKHRNPENKSWLFCNEFLYSLQVENVSLESACARTRKFVSHLGFIPSGINHLRAFLINNSCVLPLAKKNTKELLKVFIIWLDWFRILCLVSPYHWWKSGIV